LPLTDIISWRGGLNFNIPLTYIASWKFT
jgi:hypothetical protein